jgi:hypothetical protein
MRKALLWTAQSKLMDAKDDHPPTSDEARELQHAIDRIESLLASVRSEIQQIAGTPAATAPADPAEILRIKHAIEELRKLNVSNRAARDIVQIVSATIEGASAATAAGSSAAAASVAFEPSWIRPVASDARIDVRDGRYSGGTDLFRVEVRVDRAVSRIVSADLFARENDGSSAWIASLRTNPGEALVPSGAWAVTAADRNDAIARGSIRLDAVTDVLVNCQIQFQASLEGVPWGRPILVPLEWQGDGLRRLGIEIETETGVGPIPEYSFAGVPMNLERALASSGLDVWMAGVASELPNPPEARPDDEQRGWSEKDLEGLMRDFAETGLDRPEFILRLLWLSRSNREGLLGIMFDSDDELQRQGVAVFADEIRAFAGSDASRKLLQTTVHEIGHALNLAHRFEREVGRADSTSFMNYDWRYKGGRHATEFWRNFSFTFDGDELAFLRHAPHHAVVPGGRSFRSVRYWADGDGGYASYYPETALPGIRLEILPPEVGGQIFDFGQPIILGLRLTNTGDGPIELPSHVLDAKAGSLEIAIRRLDLGNRDRRDVRIFTPIITRCFDTAAGDIIRLQPGESTHSNVNLTFGSAGFPFAEPGFYEVRAFVVFYSSRTNREYVAPSLPVRLKVAAPHSVDDERNATVLFSRAAGRYFALGGTRSAIEEKLEEVVERRLGASKGKRDGERVLSDPIAVNILRAKAFRVGRTYHGRDGAKIARVQNADPAQAAALLALISQKGWKVFDSVTATQTQRYLTSLSNGANEQ